MAMPEPRILRFVALSLLVVVAFYLLREHWGHALGLLPYGVLLLCPLMHLFTGMDTTQITAAITTKRKMGRSQ